MDDRLRGDGFDALAVQIEGDGVRALFGEVAVDEVIDPLLLVSLIFGVVLQIDLVGGEAVFALITLITLFALRALCADVSLFAADDAAVDLPAVGEGDDQIAVAVDGEAVDADAVLAVLPVFAGDLGDELLERARVAQLLRLCVYRAERSLLRFAPAAAFAAGGKGNCAAAQKCEGEEYCQNFSHCFLPPVK